VNGKQFFTFTQIANTTRHGDLNKLIVYKNASPAMQNIADEEGATPSRAAGGVAKDGDDGGGGSRSRGGGNNTNNNASVEMAAKRLPSGVQAKPVTWVFCFANSKRPVELISSVKYEIG